MRRAAVAGALLLTGLAGCAPRRGALSYRLLEGRDQTLLVPPYATGAPEAAQHFHWRHVRGGPRCDVHTKFLNLTWRGHTAWLMATPFEIGSAAAPVGPRGALPLVANGLPIPVLNSLRDFRNRVEGLAAHGCVTAAAADAILARVGATLPLGPTLALYLRYGPFATDGVVDLVPGMRLKAVVPIANAAGQTIGYNTSWQQVLPRPGGGVELRPAGRGSRLYLCAARGGHVAGVNFAFPPRAAYWRFLLWIARSPADHPILLLAATEPRALRGATSLLRRDPERCAALAGPVWCHNLTYGAVITAELRVRVQGRDVYVPLSATVAQAIGERTSHRLQPSLERLRVYRRLGDALAPIRFDPRSRAILDLPVMGGDEISW